MRVHIHRARKCKNAMRKGQCILVLMDEGIRGQKKLKQISRVTRTYVYKIIIIYLTVKWFILGALIANIVTVCVLEMGTQEKCIHD